MAMGRQPLGGWEPVLPVLHTASTASYSPHFGVSSPMPPRERAHIAEPRDIYRLRRHPCQRPDLTELLPHLPPRVACVGAHEQLAVKGAGQHQVRVGWMGRDAADIAVWLAGQGQRFPGFPSVSGALHRAYGGRRGLAMTHK